MRLLPRFREERILREQVALVYRNYYAGILGFFFVTILATTILYIITNPPGLFYWLAANTLVCAVPLIRYAKIKDKETIPKIEAHKQVREILCIGLVWAASPFLFADGDNTVIMVMLTAFTTGLTAAALTMMAPVLPVFLSFAFTCMPALALSLFMIGGAGYFFMGIAAITYLVTLTFFGTYHERTIKDSVELRFANLELIEQLREAMYETKEANKAKSMFLAAASHDLRQPLHAMGLFIETLSGTKLDEKQQEVLGHVDSAAEATREMLNNLLDFSKLDAGVIKPQPRHFRLQRVFSKLEDELAGSADNKELIYRTRETTVAVHTDMGLLELILRNLISNAIRYTKKGGVLVTARVRGKEVSIEIWDTGIGIPKKEHENIFKEFHQLGNPERDRKKGFGLGLAIVAGLVESMGIELTLSSRRKKGSVFRVRVPLSDVPVVNDMAENDSIELFEGKKIIVIDDDESIRVAMEGLLFTWGCECEVAESETDAIVLLKAKSFTPDLIIADYRLREERTGREAIAAVRKELNAQTAAIIITGDTAPDRLREAQAVDAMLLHKPVAATELQRAMSRLLGTGKPLK